ncbi:hypothetical protein [Methylobacterium sp. B1]|uniref:hypothetical protein n=1 Tax=Methylobacterium sp. B1 TaxID=91459 RepID=UPI001651070D|nr:hypothetical protein [Methylobacterium sp. B1]
MDEQPRTEKADDHRGQGETGRLTVQKGCDEEIHRIIMHHKDVRKLNHHREEFSGRAPIDGRV